MRSHAPRLAALALALAAAAPAAAAEPEIGARLGTEVDAIAAALAEDGWEMIKYEREAGRLEVYAVKEDRRVEARLDPATGEVVALEAYARRGARIGAPNGGDGPRAPGGDDALRAPGGDDALRARLDADGYAIRKFERERGRIEVYAEKDGRLHEIDADARTGEILKIEEEDR